MSTAPPRVAAVLSLFHPSLPSLGDLIRAVAAEADLVVLVDDTGVSGSGSCELDLPANCHLLVNEGNRGLGYALNRGWRRAVDAGAEVIVTLDQDASLSRGYLRLAASLLVQRRGEDPATAAVAPRRVNGHLHLHRHRHGEHECSVAVVQSGLAVSAEALEQVGGFREDFVIDALEVDFVMRLHRGGRHLVLEEDLDLDHAIGDPIRGALAGVGFSASNHSSRRSYYIARNYSYLAFRNLVSEPGWSILAFWGLAKRALKTVLNERDRTAKLAQLARGVRDGLLGRLGPRA